MKTDFISAAIFAALLLAGNVTAGANSPQLVKKNAIEKVRDEIARNIPCPDFVEGSGIVNQVKAIVQVDDKGHIHVLEANSMNQKLKDYVIDRLQHMQIKNPGENQRFVLLINFEITE